MCSLGAPQTVQPRSTPAQAPPPKHESLPALGGGGAATWEGPPSPLVNAKLFPKCFYHISLPPTFCKNWHCSTFLPTLCYVAVSFAVLGETHYLTLICHLDINEPGCLLICWLLFAFPLLYYVSLVHCFTLCTSLSDSDWVWGVLCPVWIPIACYLYQWKIPSPRL